MEVINSKQETDETTSMDHQHNESEDESKLNTNKDDDNNKENESSAATKQQNKSDKSLLEMIKSRPKRPNRKGPSRSRRRNESIDKTNDVNNKLTKSSEDGLDTGLDIFFQSTSVVLKRRAFGETNPSDSLISNRSNRSSRISFKMDDGDDKEKTAKDDKEDSDSEKQSSNRLCPTLLSDKIARSRSSPNLIDPRKMLPTGDPRVNLSIIKELRFRQKTGELSSHCTGDQHKQHISMLSEMKAKNRSTCPKKESADETSDESLTRKDKPPLFPILKPLSSSSVSSSSPPSSSSSSLQSPGSFFNVKLRQTKNNQSNLIKSYTRASFPVCQEKQNEKGEKGSNSKRNSENCLGSFRKKSESDDGDDKKTSNENSSSSEDESDKDDEDAKNDF